MALNLKTETAFFGDATAAQSPLPPDQIAPHFPQLEILECLGRGGMGVVYKARQKTLNRFVALKLLAPERVGDPKFAERFTREAQALAALNHPNIVTIYDFGQAGGFYYLLMEFVDGVNLRHLLSARKFTPEEALAIVPTLCEALQFAHERDIVHRDIKPENILLDKNGRVKVADFGIAKMLGNCEGERASEAAAEDKATQSVVGTPGYSAPEQKSNPQHVDSRADIYSLGVIFYEMLTGELPGEKIEPPSRKVHIDVRLDEVVLRALENRPELRYQQASIFKTQIETIISDPASAEAPVAPVETDAVDAKKQRWEVTAWGLLIALGWVGVGEDTMNIGWLIVLGGVVAFLIPTLWSWSTDNPVKIRLAGQMVLTNGIAVCSAMIWGAVNGLPPAGAIPAVCACLIGIAYSLHRLTVAAKSEPAAPSNFAALGAICAAMSAGVFASLYLLPTSWLSAGDIRIWLTPVFALPAILYGGFSRRHSFALPAMIFGGVILLVWLAITCNAQRTQPWAVCAILVSVAVCLFVELLLVRSIWRAASTAMDGTEPETPSDPGPAGLAADDKPLRMYGRALLKILPLACSWGLCFVFLIPKLRELFVDQDSSRISDDALPFQRLVLQLFGPGVPKLILIFLATIALVEWLLPGWRRNRRKALLLVTAGVNALALASLLSLAVMASILAGEEGYPLSGALDPTENLAFGPVIERVITDGYNLDNGQFIALPASVQRSENTDHDWWRQHGIQLLNEQNDLDGVDIEKAARLSLNDWQSMNPNRLLTILHRISPNRGHADYDFPAIEGGHKPITTWGFQTPSGTMGIMQVLDEEASGARIRYRLVVHGSVPTSVTATPAATKLSGGGSSNGGF